MNQDAHRRGVQLPMPISAWKGPTQKMRTLASRCRLDHPQKARRNHKPSDGEFGAANGKKSGPNRLDKLFIPKDLTTFCPRLSPATDREQSVAGLDPEVSGPSPYFLNKFSKAWRASSGLEVEVSRSMVVRGE